jgi:hypothetical protein
MRYLGLVCFLVIGSSGNAIAQIKNAPNQVTTINNMLCKCKWGGRERQVRCNTTSTVPDCGTCCVRHNNTNSPTEVLK